MAEMMIAIVILGLGMLMAATMFPVGWLRARDLANFTNSAAATTTAATTVQLLAHVAAPNPGGPTPLTETSFLGDVNPTATIAPDTRVHVLHLENVLFESRDIWPEEIQSGAVDLNNLIRSDYYDLDPTMANWVANPPAAQIAFGERVFPSLPAHPLDGAPAEELRQWEDQLVGRRFAWAVLHRLELDVIPSNLSEFATTPRVFTIYLVALRRTQATHRFARQDPATPTDRPTALPAEEDVLFPVPWLVKLTVAGSWQADGTYQDPVGVPSEAIAKPGAGNGGRLIAQMLMSGSVLIDRLTGRVYTVRQHRFTGENDNYDYQANVTLDREITEVDLGLNPGDNVFNGEDVRDFWVFPPPVARGGGGEVDAYPVFDGQQPVVAIETRQMVFSPPQP